MQSRALGVLLLLLAGCTLPPIHRERSEEMRMPAAELDAAANGRDAAVSGRDADTAPDDADAGAQPRPDRDPANRNEDLETFRSLVPKQHLFAEWPMPDNSARSKHKHSYTVSDQVITDNVTKLRWQRVLPDIYPGCTANYVFVGRARGVGTGCTWEEAKAYCERPELAKQLGPGDWRLPTKIELESLIDVSRIPAVDPLFDAFPIDLVWSSSPVPNPEGLKLSWVVDYMEGTSFDSGRYKGGRVRCVSSTNNTHGGAADYRLASQIVYDNTSRLAWQRYPDSATRPWQRALEYCESIELEGGGWRLPSLKELLTLVDSSRWMAAIDPGAFPYTKSERYWTATEFLDTKDAVYQVDFTRGGGLVDGTLTDEHYMRCVRDF